MSKRAIPAFYSVWEVADALGVCDKTVRRTIRAGHLKAHRFGRQIRISAEDYETYVAMRRGCSGPIASK